LLICIGVVPTGLLTLYLGLLGVGMGIGAIAEGELIGAFFIIWVASGVFGLVALASSAARFGADGFRVRRWEASGIACGLLACLPFPYFIYPRGVVSLSTLWVYGPVVLSAICGIVVSVSSTKELKA
jgi:hypothetical protein